MQQLFSECEKLKCTVIAVGGIEDHVHLLVGFPPTVTISNLIKQVKGSSSHFITHVVQPNKFFKWQGSYGAFTISDETPRRRQAQGNAHQESDRDIDRVANYINNQEFHHNQKSLITDWEISSQ